MLSNVAYAALFALVFVVSVEAACDTNKFNDCKKDLPAKPNATKIECVKTENWFIKSVLSPLCLLLPASPLDRSDPACV